MTTPYPKNVATREGIITNMCYTWDHSFGAPYQTWQDVFGEDFETPPGASAGMGLSDAEKRHLWNQMAQIFDNDVYPYLEFRHLIDNDRNETEP